MARGRMLNQKIAEDIDFNAMSVEAQFIFMRTVPFLDRDGLIVGHPPLLWSKVAPLLPQYAAKMPAIIDEWIAAEFVVKYTDGKTPLLFFKGFSKNQVGMRYDREPQSIYPVPPGYYRNGNGIEPIEQKPEPLHTSSDDAPPTSGNLPADIRQPSGTLSAEENRIEVEVEENKSLPFPEKPETAQPNPKPQKAKENPEQQERCRVLKEIWVTETGAKNFNHAQVNAGIKDIDRSGCTPERFTGCIRWMKEDDFWRDQNISPQSIFKKLDEYDRTLLRRNNTYGNSSSNGQRGTEDGYVDLSTYTSGRPRPPVNQIKH